MKEFVLCLSLLSLFLTGCPMVASDERGGDEDSSEEAMKGLANAIGKKFDQQEKKLKDEWRKDLDDKIDPISKNVTALSEVSTSLKNRLDAMAAGGQPPANWALPVGGGVAPPAIAERLERIESKLDTQEARFQKEQEREERRQDLRDVLNEGVPLSRVLTRDEKVDLAVAEAKGWVEQRVGRHLKKWPVEGLPPGGQRYQELVPTSYGDVKTWVRADNLFWDAAIL